MQTYQVVTHFESGRFGKVLFENRAAAQKFLNKVTLAAAEGEYRVVSIALFRESEMLFFYTPIRDPALIEKGGEQLRGPHTKMEFWPTED